MHARAALLIALCACADKAPAEPTPGGGADSAPAEEDVCEDIAPLPAEHYALGGFTGAEDFGFDAEGWLVSVDGNGNLVRQDAAGELEVIFPSVGRETAGLRILANGDVAVNVVNNGSLVIITPGGGSRTLLSGLRYPNGLEVDGEGFLYVSEQGGRQIRRVDPETGEFTVIARGLQAPNGLGFSPDFQTLYVANFGGGVIDAITRAGDGWSHEVFAHTPGLELPPPCEGLAEGDACYLETGGLGVCGGDACLPDLNLAACEGLAEGDPCEADWLGESLEGACVEGSEGLFCPSASAGAMAACEGAGGPGQSRCWIDGAEGSCAVTWEGVEVCLLRDDRPDRGAACEGLDAGDVCEVMDPAGPYRSVCLDSTSWGGGQGLTCESPGTLAWLYGYLDGMNVDACGNVYVTEYVLGKIWRFSPEGEEVEMVAQLPTAWIPNMHWGNGGGGFAERVLYVMDRMGAWGGGGSGAKLYGVEVGVPGAPGPAISTSAR